MKAPTAAATAVRRQRLATVLRGAATDLDDAALDRALAEVRRQFDQRWVANVQFSGVEATDLLIEILDLPTGDARWRAEAAGTPWASAIRTCRTSPTTSPSPCEH